MKYAIAFFLLCGCLTECLGGVTNNWNVSAGDWNASGSWSNNLAPTSVDRVNIDNGGTATIAADAVCSNLYVCSSTAKTGALMVTAGTLSVGLDEYIGNGGGGGTGTVTQTGGTNSAARYLVLGKSAGGGGYYRLNGGMVNANPLYVGWGGYGEFVMTDGIVTAAPSGSTTMHVGGAGTGLFVQSNGTVFATTGITIGDLNATGTYLLVNGSMISRNNTWVGNGGYGHVRMTGSNCNWIVYGQDMSVGMTGRCFFEALSGTLMLSNTAAKILHVGVNGNGALYLGDANGTVTVTNCPQATFGGSLYVRDNVNATGLVRGWGKVGLMGTLRNNGQIVADGYGSSRDLDLSLFGKFGNVTNSIANTSSNGWFAVNQGRLLMPGIGVASNSATVSYLWGDFVSNAVISLVNSVRFSFVRPTTSVLTGALLSVDRAELPPGVANLIGAWTFGTTNTFGSVTLTFRYDDAAAAAAGTAEANLACYQYVISRWVNVTASVDAGAKTLTTVPLTGLGTFVIGRLSTKGTVMLLR